MDKRYVGYTAQEDIEYYDNNRFIRVQKEPCDEFTQKVEFNEMFTLAVPPEEKYNEGGIVIVEEFTEVYE